MAELSTFDQAWELFHVLAPTVPVLTPPLFGSDPAEFVGALEQAAVAFDLDVAELVADLDRHEVECVERELAETWVSVDVGTAAEHAAVGSFSVSAGTVSAVLADTPPNGVLAGSALARLLRLRESDQIAELHTALKLATT